MLFSVSCTLVFNRHDVLYLSLPAMYPLVKYDILIKLINDIPADISFANARGIDLYPSKVIDIHGLHSTSQPLQSLAILDQNSTEHDNNKGVEFGSYDTPYDGIFIFKYEFYIPMLICIFRTYA